MRGQVEVVIHVLVGDATIGVDKTRVHIKKRGMGESGHCLLDQHVDLAIALSQAVGQFTPGQDPLGNRCTGTAKSIVIVK